LYENLYLNSYDILRLLHADHEHLKSLPVHYLPMHHFFPDTLPKLNSTVLTGTTSKPFRFFPTIAGWPQKKQFDIYLLI
jgi:hypothetical protein